MTKWFTLGDTLMILIGGSLPVFDVDGDTGNSDYNFCSFAESLQANTMIMHWTRSTRGNIEERRRLTV